MTTMTEPAATQTRRRILRPFDGIVCFGGVDWWYHNRGHYDLQLMRELSAHVPVLYVNSIGMRVPTPGEGRMFVRRVVRKLRSVFRGATTVAPGFTVLSPLAPPAMRSGSAGRLVAAQVRRAARRLGITRPLVWVACPPARHVVDALEPAGVVFQRTDRFEAFHGVDPVSIASDVTWLRRRADVVLYCSRELMTDDGHADQNGVFVDHGVDLRRFAAAGDRVEALPELANVPHPRAGFIGGIDAHTFDPELFAQVVGLLPDVQFVLVGGRSIPEERLAAPNVHLMGRKPFDEVHRWMAACDVLLMPWNRSEWIKACNPVKLKEYLAVGRPIVSTPFPELAAYGSLVRVAQDATGFARQVRDACFEPHDPRPGRAFVAGHGWDVRARQVVDALDACGLMATSHGGRRNP